MQRDEDIDAQEELTALQTFLTDIKAMGGYATYRLEFGWEDTDGETEYYNPCCYVETWSIRRESYLRNMPWLKTDWAIQLLVTDPDDWTANTKKGE